VYGWPGIGVQLNLQSERTERENNWYSRAGRIVAVKVEAGETIAENLKKAGWSWGWA
jgi:hypothetical protein